MVVQKKNEYDAPKLSIVLLCAEDCVRTSQEAGEKFGWSGDLLDDIWE